MDFENIEDIIIKFFFQSATMDELEVLNKWIEDPENQEIFQEYIKTHFAVTLATNEPDIDALKTELLQEIRKEKRKKLSYGFRTVMKYAAVAVLFLGIGYVLQQDFFSKDSEAQLVVPRVDEIKLMLENGDVNVIAEEGSAKIYNASGEIVGEQSEEGLIYGNSGQYEKLAYNTLYIPNGKRFKVTLSDGTLVHLNAGSTIKYPVQFIGNEIRKVFLKGEAFFEVTPDKNHAFIVNSDKVDVKVYGTKFNVHNYEEDAVTEVVLVEGSVSLVPPDDQKGDNEIFLSPGYKATFNNEDLKISQEKVNTSIYTSWMAGNIVFRNETFENIIQKLERHYNVIIINNNEKLAMETFNATIETDTESIVQVFSYFKKVYQIDYQIVENKIIIQ